MSMKGTLDPTAMGADSAAALSDAIRQLREKARSVADTGNLLATGGEKFTSDFERAIADLQAKLADFQTLALDRLLEGRQGHEQRLASQLDVLRRAEHQRTVERQHLRQRLHRTQEALRYANASGEGLRQIDRLLRTEVLKVTDCIQVPMLQESNRSAHFNAAWYGFLESGRISPSVDTERDLWEVGDEPLHPVTAPTVLQR